MTVEKENLQPVYLIVGPDKLRRNVVLERLKSRLEKYGDLSLNTSEFDGQTSQGSDIVNSCNTMPFASDMRLVVVNDANSLNKENSEQIIDYLNNPSTTCILVLIADKLAKNTRLYKSIAKINSTCIINCENPKAYELRDKVIAIARTRGGSITPDGASKLIELIGNDTVQINSEIQKLLLSTKDNNITINDVLQNSAKTTQTKPWDFTNYFASKNVIKALQTLHEMDNNAPYVLLPMTRKRIKELMCVKDMGTTASQNAIASRLKLAPWQCKNHIAWANNFSNEQLRNLLYEALNCEADIKSGANPISRFEMFVIDALS